jgi:D-alanine-D-alanine ligase
MSKIKLGLIYGGVSTEHEVSISSYESIIKNIDKDKYEITSFYISKDGTWFTDGKRTKDVFNSLKEMDCVFPILHGKNGEDGNIAGMLEIIGVSYVGCKTLSSAICMDKVITKKLLEKANISVAKYMFIKKLNDNFYWVQDNYDYVLLDKEILDLSVSTILNYPVVVKPSRSGSSVGVSVANDYLELENAINESSIYDDKILIEEFIDGKELEVAVLGNNDLTVSNIGNIIPDEIVYSYNSKYKGNSKTVVLNTIEENLESKIKNIVLTTYKVLDCSGLARVDLFLIGNEVLVNEVNTMPGFTSISMYPKLMESINISYTDLIDRLISLSMNDKNRDFS